MDSEAEQATRGRRCSAKAPVAARTPGRSLPATTKHLRQPHRIPAISRPKLCLPPLARVHPQLSEGCPNQQPRKTPATCPSGAFLKPSPGTEAQRHRGTGPEIWTTLLATLGQTVQAYLIDTY